MDGHVDVIVEIEQVAENATVEQGAVGISVREVGGLKILRQELLEDFLRERYLPSTDRSEVKDRKSSATWMVMVALLDC